ncbi:MAG: CopG family transcriptional regulator [Hyphomicrobiales bacterium]|nr:CopG family transcriptional regulator [Hyphomicrobiales bacterium]MDE2016795.1 CopG family transcriptional regulator [Hyphomicrobiales bacterium]
MRTTVTIDDDVLHAARSIARGDGRTLGEVLSELARVGPAPTKSVGKRNGIPQLAARAKGVAVTLAMVNALSDDEP